MQNIGGKSQEYLNYSIDILKWKMFRIYKLFPAHSVPEKWSEYLKICNTFLAQNRLHLPGHLFFRGTKISRASPHTRTMWCKQRDTCNTHDVMPAMWCTWCDTGTWASRRTRCAGDMHNMMQCDAGDVHNVTRCGARDTHNVTQCDAGDMGITLCASRASHHVRHGHHIACIMGICVAGITLFATRHGHHIVCTSCVCVSPAGETVMKNKCPKNFSTPEK